MTKVKKLGFNVAFGLGLALAARACTPVASSMEFQVTTGVGQTEQVSLPRGPCLPAAPRGQSLPRGNSLP